MKGFRICALLTLSTLPRQHHRAAKPRELHRQGSPVLSRSQSVTLKRGQNIKYRPYAFTEHGILMLSSVLNGERAIQVNIEIMRAFVKLRRMLASNAELSRRFDELESKYDRKFGVVFDAIRQLMSPPLPRRKQIGFRSRSGKK
jgi:hypothetical protein